LITALVALATQVPRHARVDRYAAGGWTLRVVRDAFTDVRTCDLRSLHPAMIYRAGAIAFAFRSRMGTEEAWYRLDGANPVRWADRIPMLTAMGVPIDQGGLENPTGGLVWIPAGELRSTNEIQIRPRPGSSVKRFRLGGFAPMLAAARRLGCAADTDFAS